MNPTDLAIAIESLIVNANNKYGTRIKRIQDELFASLVLKLKEIQTDEDGYILQSSYNRSIIAEAEVIIDHALSDNYISAVNEQIAIIPKLDDLNNEYFSNISESF